MTDRINAAIDLLTTMVVESIAKEVMHPMFCLAFYARIRDKCSIMKVASFGGMAPHL